MLFWPEIAPDLSFNIKNGVTMPINILTDVSHIYLIKKKQRKFIFYKMAAILDFTFRPIKREPMIRFKQFFQRSVWFAILFNLSKNILRLSPWHGQKVCHMIFKLIFIIFWIIHNNLRIKNKYMRAMSLVIYAVSREVTHITDESDTHNATFHQKFVKL